MALSYRSRKRWALAILLVGLPVYVVAAVNLVAWVDRPSFLVELGVYVALGFVWALPFRFIFRGIGQPEPPPSTGTQDQAPSKPRE